MCPWFRPAVLQQVSRQVGDTCAGRQCTRLLGFVPVVVVVGTPWAPTAGCRVVAAPRLCKASRAEC